MLKLVITRNKKKMNYNFASEICDFLGLFVTPLALQTY